MFVLALVWSGLGWHEAWAEPATEPANGTLECSSGRTAVFALIFVREICEGKRASVQGLLASRVRVGEPPRLEVVVQDDLGPKRSLTCRMRASSEAAVLAVAPGQRIYVDGLVPHGVSERDFVLEDCELVPR